MGFRYVIRSVIRAPIGARGAAARRLVVFVVAITTLACSASDGPVSEPVEIPGVRFLERTTIPAEPLEEVIASVMVVNASASDLRVSAVTFDSEDGLTTSLLGVSTCKRTCVGIGPAMDSLTQAQESITAQPPFTLHSEERRIANDDPYLRLVLLLKGSSASEARCLHLNRVILEVDGQQVAVTYDGGWLVGILRPEPRPRNYKDC